jgi:hypothetical protein
MMQDLLSLEDKVLLEVFQYSKPAKYDKIPLHVWLRLRSAMEGLVVRRSFDCWNWYHRQLSETVKERYSSEDIVIIRQMLGRYLSNIVPKEVVEKRLITSQPLQFTRLSIWFENSVVNELRCIDGFYQLVHGNLLEEAVYELTRFDAICGFLLCGKGFAVVECLHLLLSKLKESNMSEALITRVNHYWRWLYQDMTFMTKSPKNFITLSATSQPIVSIVRKDMNELIKTTRDKSSVVKFDRRNQWWRGTTIGGLSEFTSYLATFLGYRDCFSYHYYYCR